MEKQLARQILEFSVSTHTSIHPSSEKIFYKNILYNAFSVIEIKLNLVEKKLNKLIKHK